MASQREELAQFALADADLRAAQRLLAKADAAA